jgi:4a-hydroxytetrahydrobiopterin dehydratase
MADPLTQAQIEKALSELPGWRYADDKISKQYKFHHFREAFSFLSRVAFEAEDLGHHPEIFNVYNTVNLALSTHDADGKVTQKDIDLAKAIEAFNWL